MNYNRYNSGAYIADVRMYVKRNLKNGKSLTLRACPGMELSAWDVLALK